MKKKLKLLVIALLVMTMAIGTLTITASAGTTSEYLTSSSRVLTIGKAGTLMAGKYVTDSNSNTKQTLYLYKFTLSKTCSLRFSLTSYAYGSSSYRGNFWLFNSSKEVLEDYYCYKATGSYIMVLQAGTYYLANSTLVNSSAVGSGVYDIQIKITAAACSFPTNFCRSRAATLKSLTSQKIYQAGDCDYSRWFKITTTKTRYIKVVYSGYDDFTGTSQSLYPDVTIYDAKGRKVQTTSSSGYTKTKAKVSKGTYYIKVGAFDPYDEDVAAYGGRYMTLKWGSVSN